MELEHHIEALRTELASLASIGDEHVAAAAERLSQALSSTVGLRLLEVLSEAALEIGSQIPGGHVEIRLQGHEPSLLYVAHDEARAAPSTEDGLSARITLRLPESLKGGLEAAATREGVSVNTWIVKALARGLANATVSKIGSRLTGYGRS